MWQYGTKRQRGAALVVGLIMLIVVTLLSLAAMQSVRLEEKIAGNTYEALMTFDMAEYALRGVENCVLDKDDSVVKPWVLQEGASATGFAYNKQMDKTAANPLDPETKASWDAWDRQIFEKNCRSDTLKVGTLFRMLQGKPWFVVEQLPNARSDETLAAGAKRDQEVFRASVLASNRDPATPEATSIVILQSILWR